MICYETSLNGRKLCVAGAEGYGVLGVNLTWVSRDPARRAKGEPHSAFDAEEHTLSVGGLFQDEHVDWVRARRVQAGDVIRVRVLSRSRADEPTTRRPMGPPGPGSLAQKKAYLANLEGYLPELRRAIRDEERASRAAKKGSKRVRSAKGSKDPRVP